MGFSSSETFYDKKFFKNLSETVVLSIKTYIVVLNMQSWDFLDGPVVKNPPSKAEGLGGGMVLTPCGVGETKIPHATG